MNKKSEIENELERIDNALIGGKLTDKQYCELYAAQQALAWVLDKRIAACPFDTVMNGKIWAPKKESVINTPAN